jgi:hypothetical protein
MVAIPYGYPITSDLIVADAIVLDQIALDSDAITARFSSSLSSPADLAAADRLLVGPPLHSHRARVAAQ